LKDNNLKTLALALGLGTAVVVALQVPGLTRRADIPSILLWIGLAVVAATLTAERLARSDYLKTSFVMVFTILLLFGTGPAIVAGWLSGIVTALSSGVRGRRRDMLLRISRNSARHTFGLVAAGLILWQSFSHLGFAETPPHYTVFLRLLIAYAVYVAVRWFVDLIWLRLEHGILPQKVFGGITDMGRILAWLTPAVSFVLALAYANSGVLLIGMLVTIGLARVLTVGEDRWSRASLASLIDAVRFVRIGDMTRLTNETERVNKVALAIARAMHLPSRSMTLLEKAAVVHNIGYISAERTSVARDKQLTQHEMGSILKHPGKGMRLLRGISGMEAVADIVHCHHESPDGMGFPRHLTNDDIPLEASIIKVSEAYVAMTSPRLYRSNRMSSDDALGQICMEAGKSFDAAAVYYLLETMERDDLAIKVARNFGFPDTGSIKARLHKFKSADAQDRRSTGRRPILNGLGLLAASIATLALLTISGWGTWVLGGTSRIANSVPVVILFAALLGYAALKTIRLDSGARVSWASAILLAAALTAGPIYACLFGVVFIGWSILFNRPEASLPESLNTGTSPSRDNIVALIKQQAYKEKHITPVAYGAVLVLAAIGSWSGYRLGAMMSSATGLGGILARMVSGALGVLSFYLIEIAVQSMLLRGRNLSVLRIWHRIHLEIYPEPITYALIGYGLAVGMDLIGPLAAIPLTMLPAAWRQSTLRRQLNQAITANRLVDAIVSVTDERDRHSSCHSANVRVIATLVAREMGKGEGFVEQLADAAILHDIGKISWPKHAASRKGPEEEMARILRLTHQRISSEIAAQARYGPQVIEMIKYHHEQFDGGGFPDGLCADEIPIGACILRVADAFEIASHEGSYMGIPAGYMAQFAIRQGSGTLYDPEVVQAFVRVLDKVGFSGLILPVDKKGTDPFSASEPGPDQKVDPEVVESPLPDNRQPVH
jgi:putative nucleotidyltransferase with HDIG domain